MEDNIETIDYTQTTLEEFQERVEKPHRPILIKNSIHDFQNNFKFSFRVNLLC